MKPNIIFLNNRPHIFTAKEIGCLVDFIKLQDEYIHLVKIVTDKLDEFEFDFVSGGITPDMKAIFDKLFFRSSSLRSKFKGGRIIKVEVVSSSPVTAYKTYVERKAKQ